MQRKVYARRMYVRVSLARSLETQGPIHVCSTKLKPVEGSRGDADNSLFPANGSTYICAIEVCGSSRAKKPVGIFDPILAGAPCFVGFRASAY